MCLKRPSCWVPAIGCAKELSIFSRNKRLARAEVQKAVVVLRKSLCSRTRETHVLSAHAGRGKIWRSESHYLPPKAIAASARAPVDRAIAN